MSNSPKALADNSRRRRRPRQDAAGPGLAGRCSPASRRALPEEERRRRARPAGVFPLRLRRQPISTVVFLAQPFAVRRRVGPAQSTPRAHRTPAASPGCAARRSGGAPTSLVGVPADRQPHLAIRLVRGRLDERPELAHRHWNRADEVIGLREHYLMLRLVGVAAASDPGEPMRNVPAGMGTNFCPSDVRMLGPSCPCRRTSGSRRVVLQQEVGEDQPVDVVVRLRERWPGERRLPRSSLASLSARSRNRRICFTLSRSIPSGLFSSSQSTSSSASLRSPAWKRSTARRPRSSPPTSA